MKTYSIAITTAKEAIRQPIFFVLILACALAMVVFTYLPYHTFGEDTKMFKDTGLALILVAGLLLALLTASNTIAEDIEHRTAITLLSKPINRRQFIVGKYLGILLGVGLLFLVVGVVFSGLLYYKVGYDAKESSKDAPLDWQRWAEVRHLVPGLLLTYFQVVVLTALSVAISTRLPMVVNIVLCFAVFFLGHLAPIVERASEGKYQLVHFTAQLAGTALPALENFNVGPAIATGSAVPLEYVGWNLLYCVLYSGVGILLAFVLFEDRDLA
jgi:ABC-type transport system involved in multi-copper enzyme maturation permease subunit